MSIDINALKVNDRESFAKFITLFRAELIEHPENWKNKTLPDFLEALGSYTEDIQGYYDNTSQHINAHDASWQIFTDLLKGARIYE
jgi:hypothetical protein